MKYAARFAIAGISVLLAIAPIPYQKWAMFRLLAGITSLVAFASAKKKADSDLDLQRECDVWDFQEFQRQQRLIQASSAIELDGQLKAEADRVNIRLELERVALQRNRAIVLEATAPEYLDALEAMQRAGSGPQSRPAAFAESPPLGVFPPAGSEGIDAGSVSGLSESQDRGQRLLQRLRKSDMSILVVGSTGSGKSHTLSAYLEFLYRDFPNADVWVISRKNDSFCGLREAGRVVRFNSLDPTAALKKLREIHVTFQERTEVIESDRPHLSTVRLILEDWSSICLILKKNKAVWDEVQIILSDIVTVGRELNIALFILAQSAILESLGLVGDANLRTCLAIVAQGLESVNNKGEKQGDYNLIQLILKNPYIIPSDEDRKLLAGELSELIAESRRIVQPVFLCTGGEAFVGLLPKIVKASLPVNKGVKETEVFAELAESESELLAAGEVERQQKILNATYEKDCDPVEYLLQEMDLRGMNQQQLDELVARLRSASDTGDTSRSSVSDTSGSIDVSDTPASEYRELEPPSGKEYQRIWGEGDFQKYLPKEDEIDFYEALCEYQDTSRCASEIIKKAWKLSSGENYRRLGQPAFYYIIQKYGTDSQKEFYSPYLTKHLTGTDSDRD